MSLIPSSKEGPFTASAWTISFRRTACGFQDTLVANSVGTLFGTHRFAAVHAYLACPSTIVANSVGPLFGTDRFAAVHTYLVYQKRNARATDDVEQGVIVPEGSSEECRSDVDCQNELAVCHSEVSSEGTSEGRKRLRHIDSEDDLGGEGGEVVLHAFAKFEEDIVRDLTNMAQMKRGGTVVINHWIPPSHDDILHRPAPNTRMLNVPYEYGALSRIFDTSHQGHDGAVIIDLFDEISEEFEPTVRCSGFTFPISEVPAWDSNTSAASIGGMRRSSALRMSHYTNCSIFVVSEDEGGCVSHFRMGKRQHQDLANEDIRYVLEQAYQRARVLKAYEWPYTSSDVLAERTTICERSTTKFAKYTFNTVDHARALFDCGVQAQMAIRKHFRMEDVYSHVPNSGAADLQLQIRQRKFRAYQKVHEAERRGLVDETVRGLFDEVWRETQDNDKWPDSDCLLLALATVINRAVFDDSKCELLAYGPLTLGAMIYRYVIVDGSKMLLIDMPNTRPDLLDHALHFTVEILCKKVHECRTIVWIVSLWLKEFLLPQLEALKATRSKKLEKKYKKFIGIWEAHVFVCKVKNYRAPERLRLTTTSCLF